MVQLIRGAVAEDCRICDQVCSDNCKLSMYVKLPLHEVIIIGDSVKVLSVDVPSDIPIVSTHFRMLVHVTCLVQG